MKLKGCPCSCHQLLRIDAPPRLRARQGSEAGGAAAAGQAGHAGTRTWRWVDALADDGGLRPSAATDGEFSGTAFVYILTATWDASRNEHAHAVCSRLSPATGSVCHVVEGVNGRLLTPEQKANFVRLGYVSLAPLPERPWYSVQLPGPLRPLGREYPMNLLQYPGGLGNTLGNIFILKMMERVSRSAASDAVYLYLEDDADAGDPLELVERVKAMRADLPEGGWDLISLAPPQDVCERSRLLPSFPRSGLIRPRFSFSRTAGVVYSKRRVGMTLRDGRALRRRTGPSGACACPLSRQEQPAPFQPPRRTADCLRRPDSSLPPSSCLFLFPHFLQRDRCPSREPSCR